MRKNWFLILTLLIGIILLILSYIPFEEKSDELKFFRFPVFEEEGYIVKPK